MVKVRLKIMKNRTQIDAIALVNSGYASRRPELLVPRHIAEALGIYPMLPSHARISRYRVASGSIVELVKIEDCAKVKVIEDDRESDVVNVDLVIAPHAAIPLMSDRLISKLGIVILDAGEGLWCFRDEIGKRVRRSMR